MFTKNLQGISNSHPNTEVSEGTKTNRLTSLEVIGMIRNQTNWIVNDTTFTGRN